MARSIASRAVSSGFHDDGELGSEAASSRALSTRPVSRYARSRRTASAGSRRERPVSICSVHATRNCDSSAAARRSSSCVTACIATVSVPGGEDRRSLFIDDDGGMLPRVDGGGTLGLTEGGGTLGRRSLPTDGGGG